MSATDYRALCKEIFGTDDEKQIRTIAATWKKKNSRNAGRKSVLLKKDMEEIDKLLSSGVKIQEVAKRFNITRQCLSQYLNSRPDGNYTMRIDYKLGTRICTVIYVDFLNEKIAIQNRTSDILNRAFGANENPTWADFEQFLVSRCFPVSRGYAKAILSNLGTQSYDTLAIAEATGGKTAEDNMYMIFRTYPREETAYA